MADTPTKVITELVRFSYLHAFTPVAVQEGQPLKYSSAILIPKSDKKTIAAIEKAIEAAKQIGKDKKFEGKIPARLKTPLRDGDGDDEEVSEEYHGHFFLNASSKTKPGIVDKAGKELISDTDVYSGMFGRVSLNFYPYNEKGSKGIAAGLNNIMKIKDGPPLSGKASAKDDFKDIIESTTDTEDDDL